MSAEERVIDVTGTRILIGSLVRSGPDDGIVTGISDYDVIDGDYGMPQGVPPSVTVLFDARPETTFSSHETATPWDPDGPFQCEDVEVLA